MGRIKYCYYGTFELDSHTRFPLIPIMVRKSDYLDIRPQFKTNQHDCTCFFHDPLSFRGLLYSADPKKPQLVMYEIEFYSDFWRVTHVPCKYSGVYMQFYCF